MNFKKVNNISGWVICAIACTVFTITREASVSFWDCGEFISCAYKLQISHPPGAPLFILLGRLFIILFSGNLDAATPNLHAAVDVNLLSSLSSGFTILFLFWTITHFAKKMLVKTDEPINREKTILIIGAGAVGALAFTFSDSFWFSAVEGIVFGVSPLFISSAFWAMLKWEEQADKPYADKWIVLIAYLVGLSIGVHLLSLLSIPAIVMIYYFRRYKYSLRGAMLAFLLGCVLTGVVQILVIQDTVKLIGWFELLFVNGMGLPFNSGMFFCLALFALAIILGLRWAAKKKYHLVELGILCFTFMMIGYSSYGVIMIRANADPAINMQNVTNPMTLVSYLDRSQYGEWPVFRGADFTAQPIGNKDEGNMYEKNERTGRYEVVGKKLGYKYDPADIHFFPRIWDADNTQGHVDFYKQWLGIDGSEPPGAADNIKWLFGYQFNWMYWRYFMWNFSGRQNDLQGTGNPRDGNWISGIAPLDNWRLGDQSKMPDSLKKNKAHTTLFMLPFILGLLGLIFQWKKDRKNAVVIFILYFFTGIAIILYLNQAGPQPRERDYSYVGSFYAFSIWIGLGVLYVYELLKKKLSGIQSALVAGSVCLLAVPLLMACQEWKAHDRSRKTLARDVAADYLNSCPPNAILFTGGDNDTYPLWYAQEVENIRPDVRVIVTTLLGTDWMIDQLRRKINKSDPVAISWAHDKYVGDHRDYIPYYDQGGIVSKDSSMNLDDAMAFMANNKDRLLTQGGDSLNYFPTHNFYIPVDKELVLHNGTVAPKDSSRILDRVNFSVSANALYKNDLVELNIIAANKWKRPICFTQAPGLGLNNFLQSEGMTYRLEPIKQQDPNGADAVNTDISYKNQVSDFYFGGAQYPNIYFDENSRRALMTMRRAFSTTGNALALDGKKDSALQVLNYGYKMMTPSSFPYGMVSAGNMHDITSLQYAYAYYLAGDTAKGDIIADEVISDCQQQIEYYTSLPDNYAGMFQRDLQTAQGIIKELQDMKANLGHIK
jgi:Protein O-mannosyl-transferase TMEM260-like